MRAAPSITMISSSSKPLTLLNCSSTGRITWLVISSGLAPGNRTRTLTMGGSAFGKRSTPRSRNEKTPSTTRNSISIVVNTGRRTQTSANVIVFFSDPHLRCLEFATGALPRERRAWLRDRFLARAERLGQVFGDAEDCGSDQGFGAAQPIPGPLPLATGDRTLLFRGVARKELKQIHANAETIQVAIR